MNPDVVTFLLILLVNFVITFLYWLFFFVIQKKYEAGFATRCMVMLLCPVIGPIYFFLGWILRKIFFHKPVELTDGLEKLLKPFSKIGLPSHELALMMTIALRFIPTLMEETDKIIKAQQARGADFESGNLFQRAKNLVPILIPLFVSSFRIASDLALAMEARCYHGGDGRTRMNEIHFHRGDAVAAVLMILFLALIIASRQIGSVI